MTNIYDPPVVLKTPSARLVLLELTERHARGQAGVVLIADADDFIRGRVCGSLWSDGLHVTADGVEVDFLALQKYLQRVVL